MLWHERRAHVRVRMALTDRHSVFLAFGLAPSSKATQPRYVPRS